MKGLTAQQRKEISEEIKITEACFNLILNRTRLKEPHLMTTAVGVNLIINCVDVMNKISLDEKLAIVDELSNRMKSIIIERQGVSNGDKS